MRTLLVVMTVFCVWVGVRVNWARNNRARVAAVVTAVTEIEKLGGEVTSAYEDLRPQSWLETLFDDPGSRDDPVGVLKVTMVSFGFSDLTDAGLEHLKDSTELSLLDLNGPQVTDAVIEHLKGLTELEVLYLSDTRVTDTGLEHLKDLPKLKELNLFGTQVTDAGLEHLKDFPKLTILNLSDTQVTDAGLEHLKDLPELTILWLSRTQFTDEGVKKLQQALPNCEIIPDYSTE